MDSPRLRKASSARVLFITTGLDTGGAERMLVKILARLHGRDISASLVSLSGRGPISTQVEALGVPVRHLNLNRLWRLPFAMASLVSVARSFRPDVIQGWMYHGNVAAWIASGSCAGRPRLIWGIRQSLCDIAREKSGTRRMIGLGSTLSGRAVAIVYNSETARRQHEEFGFATSGSVIIDNGFEIEEFRPDPSAYLAVREELGISPETRLVGLIARSHPMKSHNVFLQAASVLGERAGRAHFLLAGKDVVPENPSFAPWLDSLALKGRIHLLGERSDIPRLTAALDIASSSSSWGEAFSNALGEAMSCAVPCVATDVGDVKRILGDTGIVVPVGDSKALADAWTQLLTLPDDVRRRRGELARARIAERFSMDSIAARYEALYREGYDE